MASSQLRALLFGLALGSSIGLQALQQNASLATEPSNKTVNVLVNGTDMDEPQYTMEDVSEARASIKKLASELQVLVQSDEALAKSELGLEVKSYTNTLEAWLKETASITDPAAAMKKFDTLQDTAENLMAKVAARLKEVQQKLEKDRQDSKNAVEEYVYDLRSRLLDDLSLFETDERKQPVNAHLDDTENWLYEEGEDLQKHCYVDRLTELKKMGDPIKERHREFHERPAAIEGLSSAIQLCDKAVTAYKSGDDKYSHIDQADMDKVEKHLNEKRDWLDKNLGVLTNLPRHQDPPTTAKQIWGEKHAFESQVHPILNKPKPKPKVEEPPPAKPEKPEEKTPAADPSMDVE